MQLRERSEELWLARGMASGQGRRCMGWARGQRHMQCFGKIFIRHLVLCCVLSLQPDEGF